MKVQFIVKEDLELMDGLYFDTVCFHNGIPTSVRFVFFNHEGEPCRAMLSNIEEFSIEGVDTSIIPESLRFRDTYMYAGLISPYGYRRNTVGGALELYNRCFGSYVFDLVPNQTVWVESDTQPEPEPDRFIASNYGDTYKYTDQHHYHYSHSAYVNMPKTANYKYRIGVELEVEARSEAKLNKIRKFESNWFFMERDGSLNEWGVEFVTIPLLPKDAHSPMFWSPLCATLLPMAKSWDSRNCGLHIHIGREILGATAEERSASLGKLLYLYHHYLKHTQMNTAIFGRAEGYHDLECKSGLVKAVDILGTKVLKKKAMCDAIDRELKDKSNEDRYFDINILNSHTVEFRRGKGSLRPERIAAVVEYCEMLCKYARRTKWDKISEAHFVQYMRTNLIPDGALSVILEENNPF